MTQPSPDRAPPPVNGRKKGRDAGRRRAGEAWASSLLRQGAGTDAQDLNHQLKAHPKTDFMG